jgi:hypothetical protein
MINLPSNSTQITPIIATCRTQSLEVETTRPQTAILPTGNGGESLSVSADADLQEGIGWLATVSS